MVLEYWAFACLERGRDLFWRKVSEHLGKNVSCQVEFVENRQLGWEPDVCLGGVWAGSYSSGLQCDVAK